GGRAHNHEGGCCDQAEQGGPALGMLEVEGKAALVAVEGGKEAGGETAETARVIATRRRFDLHHIGAEIGKQEASRRTHHGVAELKNLEPGQGGCRHQAARRRKASRLPAWMSPLGS